MPYEEDLNWDYGSLESGKYRIVKSVSLDNKEYEVSKEFNL